MTPPDGVTEQTMDRDLLSVEILPAARRTAELPKSLLMRREWALYKRAQDIIFAVMIIALLCVPLSSIAIWVKCTSKGPILFRQPRRGYKATEFTCFKFRTMYSHFTDAHAKVQSSRNDHRITPAGVWLRKTSLDELPQLFNVLLGHMSLIGPRPHALGTNINGRLLPDLADNYVLRYAIRPGITGWAQVNGWRGILDTEEKLQKRIEHDLYYIAHWTPLMDMRIFLKTFFCIFDNHAF